MYQSYVQQPKSINRPDPDPKLTPTPNESNQPNLKPHIDNKAQCHTAHYTEEHRQPKAL